ncbi:unnamed protein product [Caenorhabditis angaria]|uniref:C-type lectin domain-containing protein n=1 Tax=Caenorhabditis angaria TaxID=860376 RepID=A0A9P1IMF8_9PELO|nr:unnamed protein product [Caenorhabditis angaria]
MISLISYFSVLFFFLKPLDLCVPTQAIEEPLFLTTSTTSTTTTPAPICLDSTWTLFDRGTYFWCMKIYRGSILGPQAAASCASLDSSAVPSGFQDTSEISKMMSVASSEVPGSYYLFIGAYRTMACEAVVDVDATCTYQNSFAWTDGHTSGTDGFNWRPGQPENGLAPYGKYQMYCLVNTDGYLDDTFDDEYFPGAVCGMLAR